MLQKMHLYCLPCVYNHLFRTVRYTVLQRLGLPATLLERSTFVTLARAQASAACFNDYLR